jgi:DNA mismatch repair protein MutL
MRIRPERRSIRVLDEQVVNRIAAGEVVERPASAVKELIENSLDAGARRIEVEVEMGGRRLIRVRDDGIGMTREDALLALQRHATSKIQTDADLLRIQTMGFRGEALPSIAAVSRLELITRAFEEEIGTRVVAVGGEIQSVEEVGAPIGTTVTVRDLFYNVPARLKFLKTVPTELGHILETVTRYAFAFPDVSFRLVHERQELLFTPGSGDRLAAVAAVWGRETVRSMVEVDYERDGIHVYGLIAPPHQTRPTRQHQYFYVNLRPVRNKTLTAALDEAYRTLTPEKRYPACVLLVDMNPRLVDVNVHPAKIEVKFQREGEVFEAVVQAIRAALLEHGMIPSAVGAAAIPAARPHPTPPVPTRQEGVSPVPAPPIGDQEGGRPATLAPEGECESPRLVAPAAEGQHAGATPQRYVPDVQTVHRLLLLQRAGLAPRTEPAEEAAPTPPATQQVLPTLQAETEPLETAHLPFAHLLDDLQILGQVQNTFIVASTRKGLVIIDQHVAHERVLYEQFCEQRGGTPIPRQPLLNPEPLTLDRRSALLLQERLEELNRIGFELEPFGQDTYLVRSVPVALAGHNPLEVLRDIIEELVELSVSRRLPVAREQIWITTACKLAVKAGDPLNLPEMQKLLEDLARTQNPYLCPHGRPITLTLTWEELERRFKRR